MKHKPPDNEKLNRLRHSAAHLLASAVMELYPKVKLGIGPATQEGFYYDFDFGETRISDEDLEKIEEQMRKIQKRSDEFQHAKISISEARKIFADQPYKLELIDGIQQEIKKSSPSSDTSTSSPPLKKEAAKESAAKVSIYRHGNFVDLCRGPHVKNTREIGAFKLLSIAGAYWRGDENNRMLTRIYGTAFPSQEELDQYLRQREEAQRRDHRKLGKKLGIYLTSSLVGSGLPLYGPAGAVIIENIENFMRQLQHESGYSHVYTPHIAKEDLFQKSGHLRWFADGMYPPMEFEGEGKYYAKPMNCPFHIQIYQSKTRSYRDLPIRYAEFGTVYRYEKSGEISGLLRTRGFTQDDAHIFCREDQVVGEFINVLNLTQRLLNGLGLKNHWHRLSLPGKEKEKYAGNQEQWNRAIQLIKEALHQKNLNYQEAEGEAAFYGPKLDIIFEDVLGREWQISTIQVDFLLPRRFQLEYVDSDGQKKQPYMIHRAPLGSRERILAVLIEHHAGAFPVWLAPEQARIIPISRGQLKYAESVEKELKERLPHLRVRIDETNETLGNKIRKAQEYKIPYLLIVGNKEEQNQTINLRLRSGEEVGEISKDHFVDTVHQIITRKSLNLWQTKPEKEEKTTP